MKNVVVIIAFLFSVGMLITTNFGQGYETVYDCRDVHWQPDVPLEVRQECNRLLQENHERTQKEEHVRKKLIHL